MIFFQPRCVPKERDGHKVKRKEWKQKMLTGKQRSYLKGLANAVPAIMQVGKAGITDSLITQVDEYLEQHELVKGSVLKNALFTAREVCEELAEELSADVITSYSIHYTKLYD